MDGGAERTGMYLQRVLESPTRQTPVVRGVAILSLEFSGQAAEC